MEKEEFLKRLETELKIAKSSKLTIRNYLLFNKAFLDFLNKDVEQASQQDVKLFLAERLIDKSESTITLALAAIKYAFTTILGKDITAGIKRPKKPKALPEVLSREEIKQLIASAKTRKSKLIIKMLYYTGMRVSELVNVKQADILLDKQEVVVRGKGKKERKIILPEELVNELRDWIAQHKGIYLFGDEKPLTARNIQKILKNAAKAAGINKKVTPHKLRHSFATHLLESGLDIRIIQMLLGHENLATTQIYTHITDELYKKAREKIQSLIV
jgi:site-specific recombinase XerD